jgi:histidinol phosphatase-like enzyme (inositol monophosphatase family)
MPTPDLRHVLDFAVAAAEAAGEVTLQHFRTGLVPETKADNTPVTIADRASEALLRARIAREFPDHGILGEEGGEQPGSCPARWILDPIDGTMSFISGVPLYSVLIGFEWAGAVLAGVIHLPALRETVAAARGLGCWWNGSRAQVSGVTQLAQARLSLTTTKLVYRSPHAAAYERLRDACYVDRGWPDAYAYALLATGRVEVVLDPAMAIWDTAALVPVVTEAGGTLTDWSGHADHTAPEALGTNGHLLDAVLRTIRGT